MRQVGKWYLGLKALLLAGWMGAPSALAQADPAELAWRDAQAADTIQAYEGFLEAYPLAPQAGMAFYRLIDLSLALEPGAGPETGRVPAELY